MSRPHVLVANIFFAPYTYGGATIVAEQVARQLHARHGWKVSALSAVSRRDLPPYALRKLQSGPVASYVINLPPQRAYAEMYSNPVVTESAARLIQALGPDLLHLHCLQELGAGPIRAAREAGVPVVVSTHDFWWLCERQFMVTPDGRYCGQDPVRVDNCRGCVLDHGRAVSRFRHLSAALTQADLVTYPSSFARDLSRASGLVARRDTIWQNGVTRPGPDFAQAQSRRRAAGGPHVFAFCGGPSQLKGWPLIRDAFSGFDRGDFKVLLVDGAAQGGWWDGLQLSRLPGTWQVVPRYRQEEMDEFWVEVDTLLFPSQWKETFGLTVREALCRGIRVIQTDSGGTVEHEGPDRDRLLRIGSGTEEMVKALHHALTRTDPAPAPVRVTSFAEQADAFVRLTRDLVEPRGWPLHRPVRGRRRA
ncbi:MAG: glycosyltransferase family 4 protein [Rhodobacteraceae bacterium]|nr:glycosyltransferase family 4 protein [Paracoccaceae bacterium]MBR9822809.1 glycosyltransferase family 4 protein [Paracoccaceae bacterium]